LKIDSNKLITILLNPFRKLYPEEQADKVTSLDISPSFIKIGFKSLIHMSLRQITNNYKFVFLVFRRR